MPPWRTADFVGVGGQFIGKSVEVFAAFGEHDQRASLLEQIAHVRYDEVQPVGVARYRAVRSLN